MRQINLRPIPNQSFSISVDGNFFDIILNTTGDVTVATVYINNVLVISGQRLVAGYPMIPYRYLQNGNFILTTMNNELPYYPQFNISQFLIYASATEIASL